MGNASRRIIFVIALLVIFAVGAMPQQTASPAETPAPQQTQPQPAGPASTTAVLKVKTRLVVVDVIVLDRKGVPVTDLKAEDFSVREEGTEQKVRVFNFQQPSQAQGQPATLVAATVPPGRITNMPRFKTNSTLNVLLLDGINVTSQNQKYAREQMLKFLEKLPAGQPLAVYALGPKLRMLQDFTTDPALLREAVKKARDNTMSVRADVSNASDLPPSLLEQMPDAMLQSILRFGQDQAINQLDERVSLTLAQLGALAGNLAGYPGRKNLIWLSEAFPAYFVPGNTTVGGNSGISSLVQPLVKSYQTQIDHASDLLSNAQVAVYPVDAATLTNRDAYSSLSNSDSNGQYLGRSTRGAGRVGLGSQQATEINRANEAVTDSHSTMNSVADQTGGKAFYNTNNLEKAVRESMDDGSTYYTLGYYPENKNWDGRFRKIAVKVNRPGVKLHYRQGFFAVEPKDYLKQDPKVLAVDLGTALDINNPISTALPFQAVVVPPSAQNGKVQINFGVDPHAIGFELREDGLQHAAIDCGVRVYSKKGEPMRVQGNTFNAALTAEQYQKVMKMIFPCSQTVELAPGEYILRLAVRDNTNGLMGTANGTATVPAVAAGQAAPLQEKKP
ncbi:MAG TPA: VWA domain-containing protein [Candidatus Angelobacter sp.]|nr:VWA domain-containing protein [Candidatus Angelobacter sp.]